MYTFSYDKSITASKHCISYHSYVFVYFGTENMETQNVIIIGGGVAGIAMAHTLKCRLGHTDFEVSTDIDLVAK